MKITSFKNIFYIILLATFPACHDKSGKDVEENTLQITASLFTLLPASSTGIDFNNHLTEGLNTNVLMYEYFYNGGGVAVGDLNGDGLQDIYFTGNMVSNKLYLNKGNMIFQDITLTAGVGGREEGWKTGVTMADVDGDGLLDMYVCYSGNMNPEKRRNQLFLNQGNDKDGFPIFKEMAKEFGLDHPSSSTQAVFFDYDLDGDLDMFLLNHSPKSLPVLDEAGTKELLSITDSLSGVRLFRNENNFFEDVTESSGILSSTLSYGLGVGVSDLNNDGWPDIYISNDYSVPDFLYLNNGDGTFTDKLKEFLGQNSHFSMGNDIADINNDGLTDIFTLDMLPEDNRRQKLLFAPDNYELFELNLKVGYHYQYMRNMLQLNNGNGTFSEIGQFAGISNTDWSWAPLFADFDNDGWKDLFVSNGYLRDYTNMDFLKFKGDVIKDLQNSGKVLRQDILALVQKMPSTEITNYLFKNNGDLTFTNKSSDWGFHLPSNSNGSVYADLDNDGDLDLVINNINQSAFIYRNNSESISKNNFLQVKLEGAENNTQGIGTKVSIFIEGEQQYLEQMPSRGYQSGVSPILHFGIGNNKIIDSLVVTWPKGKRTALKKIEAGQILAVSENEAGEMMIAIDGSRFNNKPVFKETTSPFNSSSASFRVNDFKRQPLMINPISTNGPCIISGDVNGDGIEDVFVGGEAGQPSKLYIGQKNGGFQEKKINGFAKDSLSHDVDALFFDSNGNGYLDLYVCSGGYHNFSIGDTLLQDRLYINDGKGNFTKDLSALPFLGTSTSCARASDINGDGFMDLFVGGRVVPGRYPEIPDSYILINNGKGAFINETEKIAPQLQNPGMVTDAVWLDLNGDSQNDLIVVGEWMAVKAYINTNGNLIDKTSEYFDQNYKGFWNKIFTGDFNKDGRPDLIVGNLGLNAQCKASFSEPAELVYKDFDGNGSVDPILSFYIQGQKYPYVTRDELLDQMSIMRPRFVNYASYAEATLIDIFTTEELKDAGRLEANYLNTAYFAGTENGSFIEKSLPVEVQLAPVFAICELDYDNDGNDDLILAGNINKARLRFGKYDASYGILLKGDGKGNFEYVPQAESGLTLKGDARSVLYLNNKLIFGINQHGMKTFQLQ